MELPVYTPRIVGSLTIEAPDEAYPGELKEVRISFHYKEGDPDNVKAKLVLDGVTIREGKVSRGGFLQVSRRVGSGTHYVRVLVNDNLLISDSFTIKRTKPQLTIGGVIGKLYYPNGGEIAVTYNLRPEKSIIEREVYH